MHTHADKTQKNKSHLVANAVTQKQRDGESTFQFVDNRPKAIAQRKLQEMANDSPQAKQAAQFQTMADNNSVQQKQPIQKKENNTGLPDNLKSGIENLSGYSMDDVKVHRNSDKPAQLQAHAYAQGTDIHLGKGQEKHLPHEAWHVVQQKQGRVKPTMQLKGSVNINDDAGLEKEADVMGLRSLESQGDRTLVNRSAMGIVQCMKVVPDKNAKQKIGKGEALSKLNKVIIVMGEAVKDVPGSDDSIIIEITNKGEMTPAWNHHKGTKWYPGKPGDIGVQLNKWYVEKASLGDLIGMFIHEVGVHTLADRIMRKDIKPDGSWSAEAGTDAAIEFHDQNKDHTNPIGGKIEKYPNAIEDTKNKKKGRSRQRDHVNLAKSLSGGKSVRSEIYVDLYLSTGNALDKQLHGEAKGKALRDLTQSFLFDLGRLAATDDGGAVSLIWNTKNIGELMTYYHKNILKPREDAHKWLKAASLNIKSGKWQLRGYLLGKLGALAISSNPAVQVARSTTAGLIASGVVLATGTTLATAAIPALVIGVVVGVGVHLVQKLFGF